MPTAVNAHIRVDDRGVAWIDETRTKVIEVALDQIAHGWREKSIISIRTCRWASFTLRRAITTITRRSLTPRFRGVWRVWTSCERKPVSRRFARSCAPWASSRERQAVSGTQQFRELSTELLQGLHLLHLTFPHDDT